MELYDFFQDIESPEFRSRFMIFSGFKLVRKALSRDKTISSLINVVRLNPSFIDNIGKRILFLFAENKHKPGAAYDIAVAAYLYCLYMTDQHFANRMSVYVLQQGKLWWSVDLALHIKKNMEIFADPGKWTFKFYGDPTPTENASWGTHVQPTQLNEVPPIVSGKYTWNISGQLPVSSPQKTKTLALSV